MHKKYSSIIFLILIQFAYSQSKYPTDYFINPLEVPLILSGTFGELRSNHFHAGIDIKTQGKEGLKIVSSAGGYVSRINVSLWGYGKALYVTHPNGYTTVYGHLKKFSPKIEAFVKKAQYKKETFTIRLYPKSSDLKVTKGELIALSGNSGSSGGPHLHYEIRDVKANILNPMLFGINVPDHKRPTIQSAFVYSKNNSSQVNKSNKVVGLSLKRQKDGNLLANPVSAHGEISIGINAFDRLDAAINKNGLYDLEMQVNGKKMFKLTWDKFSFSESRYINTYIDYDRYTRLRQRVQQCFINLPEKKLSLYKLLNNKGYFQVEDGLDYNVVVTAKDFEGNQTKLTIPIKGKKDTILIAKTIKKTPYFFKANQVNMISDSIVHVSFPKNIFYSDFYFDYSYKNGVAKLHNSTIPVHSNFKIYFDVSKYSIDEIKKMYIARKNKYGKLSRLNTRYRDGKLSTSSKILGEYTLSSDNQNPKIVHYNFKVNQNLNKKRYLKVKISDTGGDGIKSYRGEINGKWILMEYNPKFGTLTYDFKNGNLIGLKHILQVVVTDNVNNSTTFTTSFNRK
ncbi:MAG: M23 family metallopeptidase [Flavobacteriaceae bacterium]|nr:M23 family metallopeptidase [Flavobacteriaceae bacterium]